MRSYAILVPLFCLPAIGACADEGTLPTGSSSTRATTMAGEDVEIIVLHNAAPGRNAQEALSGDPADYWWARIEVPRADLPSLDSANGLQVDLSDAAVQIVFAQNYMDSWSPDPAAPPVTGWLQERYIAGDSGLQGRMSLRREGTSLTVSYLVDWQGITDRFGTPAWHQHISEGGFAVTVEEVP